VRFLVALRKERKTLSGGYWMRLRLGSGEDTIAEQQERKKTSDSRGMRTDRNKTLQEANYVGANEHRIGTAVAQRQAVPKPQDKLALGEPEVTQLLLLMDTDKNGKISKEEWMKFMEAEFDRLGPGDKTGQSDQNMWVQICTLRHLLQKGRG